MPRFASQKIIAETLPAGLQVSKRSLRLRSGEKKEIFFKLLIKSGSPKSSWGNWELEFNN
jgi:hypothetical protein